MHTIDIEQAYKDGIISFEQAIALHGMSAAVEDVASVPAEVHELTEDELVDLRVIEMKQEIANRKSAKKMAESEKSAELLAEAISGKTVVFSGEMLRITHKGAESWCRKKGLKVSHGLTKNTDYVVIGCNYDEDMVRKAEKNGVGVIKANPFFNAMHKL